VTTPAPGRARIAFLINTLETGGAERQLALTVAELDRTRFEPVVVTLFRAGAFRDAVERAGVAVHDLGLRKDLRTAVGGARRALAGLAPDVVHTAMFEANVAGRLAARRLGVPAVSHATNTYDAPQRFAETPVPRWKLLAARSLERWSARRSNAHIVAGGAEVARSAAAYLAVPPARVTVVRRGFDFPALEAASRDPLESPAGPDDASPRLLAVGRLAPQKAHRYLIEAMPAVVERHPSAHLVVAGAGPLEDRLRSLIERLGMTNAVTLAGVRRDVPALLATADAFVLPSLWEGAAGALVEAMALGVPVAVTDDPGLREVAAGDAEYFPPRDPSAIAEALDRIVADPAAARERATGAVARVRALHDIAANTRALERVYDETLHTWAPARPPGRWSRPPDGRASGC
jgi:glycosyltransferase involved in cell wall biosynthesis